MAQRLIIPKLCLELYNKQAFFSPRTIQMKRKSSSLNQNYGISISTTYDYKDFELIQETKEYKSEAFQFLLDFDLRPQDGFERIHKYCPAVFQLSTYELGISILNFKQAGISEDRIKWIIKYTPEALFSENCQFLIAFCELFEQHLNMSMEDGVRIALKNDESVQKNQMFFNQDLTTIEKNIQVILHFFELNSTEFSVKYLFWYQRKLQRVDPEKLQTHLKNLLSLCDECQKYYVNQDYEDQFDRFKKCALFQCVKELGYLILTKRDVQDARLKLEYLHENKGVLTDISMFPAYFYYDLEMCIKPRLEFAKSLHNLGPLKYLNNNSYFNVSLKKLLDCSNSEFCYKLGVSVEQFDDYKSKMQGKNKITPHCLFQF